MVDEIARIKAEGFTTLASCCGHGKYPRTVVMLNAFGVVMEYYTKDLLFKQKQHRYYQRDAAGHYHLDPRVFMKNGTCTWLDEHFICCNPFSTNPFSARCPPRQEKCPGYNKRRDA